MNNKSNYKNDYQDGDYFKKSYKIDYGCYEDKEFRDKINWFYGWIRLIRKNLDLGKFKDKKALEIGCADGAFLACLRNEAGIVADGAEMTDKIIDIAKKYNLKSNFLILDIEEQLIPQKYDLIFAFEVLEHIKEPEKALKNIHDSLNDGGMLIFSSAYPFPKHLSDPYHISVKILKEWREAAESVGFKIIFGKVVSFVPFLFRLAKRFSHALPFKTKNKYFVTTNFLIVQKK